MLHTLKYAKMLGDSLVSKQDLESVKTQLDYKIDSVEIHLNHRFDAFESSIKHEMEKLQNQLIIKLGIMMFSLFGGSVALGGLVLAPMSVN